VAAERRINYVKKLLDEIGIGGERLEMYFLSSAEGARWAEIATEMTERALKLGPNPLKAEKLKG
jgi:coenzyme F420-reducing hydrogenase delta subunit